MTAVASRAAGSAAAPQRTHRRPVLTAVAAVLAPWGFVITNTTYWLSTRTGGSDSNGAESLALAAAHPDLLWVCLVAGMLGCLLLVPAVVGILGNRSSSRWADVGGWLMIFGYICYFAVLQSNIVILAMAAYGGPTADFAAAIDLGQADPSGPFVFGLFVLGNLVGTLLFAIGLIRSRTVPQWAAIAIACWPPLHVTGLVVGTELFEIAGAILQAVGFAGIAVSLLSRRPRP